MAEDDPLDSLLDDPLGDYRGGDYPRNGRRADDYPSGDYGDRYPPDLPPDLSEDRYGKSHGGAPYGDGYRDDRYADSCNYNACSQRYKTFRPSDCSYKPNLYERRRCPL